MSSIKAIKTEYRSFIFRSRLEAKFAVYLDSLGVTWRYEREGFEYGGYRYLPDFELFNVYMEDGTVLEKLYIEVKGSSDNVDIKKIEAFADIMVFSEPNNGKEVIEGRPLLLVGDLPTIENYENDMKDIVKLFDGIPIYTLSYVNGKKQGCFLCGARSGLEHRAFLYVKRRDLINTERTRFALQTASKAKFEYEDAITFEGIQKDLDKEGLL